VLEKNHLLKLSLISIAAITVGALIGLALNYQTLKKLREEPKPLPTPPSSEVGEEEKEEEKIATFSGKIKPSTRPEIAANYLEDDAGNLLIFLKSGKVESGFLQLLEGQAVEVVGTVKESSNGQRVLEVDEVHL